MIARRTAIQNDLLAGERYAEQVAAMRAPLQRIVDFDALAREVGGVCVEAGAAERWPPSLSRGDHGAGGQAPTMMEMKVYSAERKAAVLQKMMLPSGLSIPELARQEGISDVTLYHWRKQAMANRTISGMDKKTAEDCSAESRLDAVVEMALMTKVELSEYCREKGIFPEQVKSWKQACKDSGLGQ